MHHFSSFTSFMRRISLLYLCLLVALVRSLPSTSHIEIRSGSVQPSKEVFHQDAKFNYGGYGQVVMQTFKSSSVAVPKLNMMKSFKACDDGSYIFVTPRGFALNTSTAVVYDATGSLLWTNTEYFADKIYNMQVQYYKGDPYLTFWGGDDSVGGHGAGNYYMLNKHYQLVFNISAGNNLGADLHSFSITPAGTVILSVYDKLLVSLSGVPGHSRNSVGWIWDSLFQEFELETGSLILQWRSSDHFPLTSTYVDPTKTSEDDPWDWFHLNSVEKDMAGNYLVSSRHLRTIFYVESGTGKVLWRLGGKDSSFVDLSGGESTHFVGQHDAHWTGEDHKEITFFNNAADWQYEEEHESKGKRIAIDTEKMTIRLVTTYAHPQHIFAFSQGSFQNLPNGNVMLGYGYTGAFTEFSKEGKVLCDAYLGPASRFASGDVQSYKNVKFNWTGIPLSPPDVAVQDGMISVSWLGSTEVKSWRLEHAYQEQGEYASVGHFAKTGFETNLHLPFDFPLRRYLRVAALDKNHMRLHATRVVDIGAEALDLSSTSSDDGNKNGASNVEDSELEFASEIDSEDVQEESEVDDEDDEDYNAQKRLLILLLGLLVALVIIMVLLTKMDCHCICRRRRRSGGLGLNREDIDLDDDEDKMAIVLVPEDEEKMMERLKRLLGAPTREKNKYRKVATKDTFS